MTPTRREDILVSICFADITPGPNTTKVLNDLAARMDAGFRFWELVLVVRAEAAGSCEDLMLKIDKVRLLKVRQGSEFYRMRAVAASEAIGDVVVLAAIDEVPFLDLSSLISTAADGDRVALLQSERTNRLSGALEPAIRVLGHASGFHVSARDMQTAAFPRTLLNKLLAHPDRNLALRFTPRDAGIPYSIETSRFDDSERRSLRDFGRRLGLVQKLLTNFAPKVLFYVATLSGLVTFTAVIYAVYAIVAWFTLDTIQPGWLTISLAVSLTAGFLGLALFGLSLGLQQVLDVLLPEALDDVVDEVSSIDLFGQVVNDLNVEVETGLAGKIDTPSLADQKGPARK